jgi:predicted transglutaminase-like cysteine proteinase
MAKLIHVCAVVTAFSGCASIYDMPLQPSDAAGQFVSSYDISKGQTAVPRGYYELCVTVPSVCAQNSADGIAVAPDGAVRATPIVVKTLVRVNRSVNRSIRPRSDFADRWSIDARFGDCEDYVLTKRERLRELGWPSSALLIALVTKLGGGEHAVLVVRTTKGNFVLDNLSPMIHEVADVRYEWERIQSSSDPWVWELL